MEEELRRILNAISDKMDELEDDASIEGLGMAYDIVYDRIKELKKPKVEKKEENEEENKEEKISFWDIKEKIYEYNKQNLANCIKEFLD